MIKKKICPDCRKEFDFDTLAHFKKKYCPKCSKERKKAYENIHNVKFEDCDEQFTIFIVLILFLYENRLETANIES